MWSWWLQYRVLRDFAHPSFLTLLSYIGPSQFMDQQYATRACSIRNDYGLGFFGVIAQHEHEREA